MTAFARSGPGGRGAIPGGISAGLAELLGERTSAERVSTMADIALGSLGEGASCPTYRRALVAALHEEPPPFGAVLYAEMQAAAAQSGQWTAVSLITNARRVGDRARTIGSMAGRSAVLEERRLLLECAISKSQRVHAYLEMLELLFPGALDAEFRAALAGASPGYSAEVVPTGEAGAGELPLNELVALHLADLRAAFQHLTWRAAADAHAPPDQGARVERALDDILCGELADIARSAALIERQAVERDPADLLDLVRRCLTAFIRETSEEPIDVSYHQRFGTYP